MKRFAVLALCLVGCGGVDFTGTYHGPLTFTLNCNDGSGGQSIVDTTWTVTDSGDVVSINTNAGCGVITATASGATASLQAKNCNGDLVTGGTATLTGGALSVAINMTTPNCGGTFAGQLAKQ